MFPKSKRLSFNKSSHFKISELIELRSADPLEFDVLFKSGEDLVSHAVSGKLKRVVEIVNSDAGSRIHSYFVVKMFQGALINGHLMIAAFIIDQGYPLCCHFIPNAFMQSLEIVDDALAISICELLVLANGMDVNCQVCHSYSIVRSLTAVGRLLIISWIQNYLKAGAKIVENPTARCCKTRAYRNDKIPSEQWCRCQCNC